METVVFIIETNIDEALINYGNNSFFATFPNPSISTNYLIN